MKYYYYYDPETEEAVRTDTPSMPYTCFWISFQGDYDDYLENKDKYGFIEGTRFFIREGEVTLEEAIEEMERRHAEREAEEKEKQA